MGPLGPVAGLRQLVEKSRRSKLSAEQIHYHLTRLRSGIEISRQILLSGLLWIVFERVDIDRLQTPVPQPSLSLLGARWIGLYVVIQRLYENDENERNVEQLVRDELRRAYRDLKREDSMNVHPNPATNTYRRKNGLDPYKTIRRSGRDVRHLGPSEPRGNPDLLYDVWDEVAKGDSRKADVFRMLFDGYDVITISDVLNLTKTRVESMKEEFDLLNPRESKNTDVA